MSRKSLLPPVEMTEQHGRSSSSYFSDAELQRIGFDSLGTGVRLSRYARVYGPERVSLGDHVRIDDFCVLSASASLVLGRNVHVAAYCALFAMEPLTMADFSGLSSRVTIYTASDDYSGASLTNPTVPSRFRIVQRGSVHLGRHVIIGAGSIILPSVSIGEGGAVGALSLVNRDIPDWTIAAGVPAKAIRSRDKGLLAMEREYLEIDG